MGVCYSQDVKESEIENILAKSIISFPQNGIVTLKDLPVNGNITLVDELETEKIIENFKVPHVPIIFVIGGPGSGKITHCQRITAELEDWEHVSMTDVIQQIIKSSESQKTNVLPTRQATATLMSVMNSNPGAAGFVVSGYPTSMRDTSEFLDLVGRVDGVILINWHLYTLERQIQNGSKQGLINLAAAHLELDSFKRHVIPVAEFFDSKQILHLVTGDRRPEEVYQDFSAVFHSILNQLESDKEAKEDKKLELGDKSVVWVVGGPGSKKYERVEKILQDHPNWTVINTGTLLWDYLEKIEGNVDVENDSTNNNIVTENKQITETLSEMLRTGDLVPGSVVVDMLRSAMKKSITSDGFVVVGFPRNIQQVESFQEKILTNCPPVTVLLDCSELELARNLGQRRARIDDNKDAVARRLQVFRETTLPMIKCLDEEERLRVVDGDKEDEKVLQDLQQTLEMEIYSQNKNQLKVQNLDEKDSTDGLEDLERKD